MRSKATLYCVLVVLALSAAYAGFKPGPDPVREEPVSAGHAKNRQNRENVTPRYNRDALPRKADSVSADEEAALEADSGLVKAPFFRTREGAAKSSGLSSGSFGGGYFYSNQTDPLDQLRADIKQSRNADQDAKEKRDDEESDEGDDLFSQEDLDELRRAGAVVNYGESGLIPGIMSEREAPRSVVQTPVAVEQPAPEEEAEEEQPAAGPRYTGQARGYAMLYLMQPEARQTVERELQTLLDSEIREVYLGVLADGTFGKDFTYLGQVLRRLSERQRVITLSLYLSNGASMRDYDVTPVDAGFAKINPEYFRSLIQSDPATRGRFTAMAQEVKPVFELNRALSPANRNVAVVMLEDNLQAESYSAMRELAHTVLGDLVQFVRNPCQGCLPGNDAESGGDPIELHNSPELGRLSQRDGFTLDGESFFFPWEPVPSKGLSIDQLLQVQRSALVQGLQYFGLWRQQRQGLGTQVLHPSARTYEVPTDEQAQIEKEVLKDGLAEIAQAPVS